MNWRALFLAFCLASGCGDGDPLADASSDTLSEDASSDALPDGAPDASVDAAEDASDDASIDSGDDASVDAGDDAALDAALDTSEADASDSAILDADTEPPRDPFPDVSLGPYASLTQMLVRSLRSNARSLDTSATYTHSAGQGYVLQAIGELLWAARDYDLPERDELIDLALGEIDELERASDRARGSGPGFGLPDAWDAFGDGSVNPAMTAYVWQSGMVALGVVKILRVLDHLGHAEVGSVREFAIALMTRWDAHYTRIADGGYWWYSAEPADNIAVHNTSALLAMAGQMLSELGGPASLSTKAEGVADLLAARLSGNPTRGYTWNYADDGFPVSRRRAEDTSHATITLQLMRFAHDQGWWSTTYMRGVATTLRDNIWSGNPARVRGAVDGTGGSDREWTYTRAATVGYAVHGDSPSGDPLVHEQARSIFFSSYLSRFARNLETGGVDSGRSLGLALLLARRPDAFASGSRWERVAGAADDDAVPRALPEGGGVRFYTVDWAEPADLAAGLTLPARRATAANANFLVDLEDVPDRVAVSLIYQAATGGQIRQWDGSAYRVIAPLTSTRDDEGTLRYFRTTFALADTRFDYQAGVPGVNVLLDLTSRDVAVHRIEATPL